MKDSGNSLHVTGALSQAGRTEVMKKAALPVTAAPSEISMVGFAASPHEPAV